MKIAAVCNFHCESNALPGFIAEAEKMFDEVVLVSSPPDGTKPDEQTIEIAKASGHKLIFDTISQGFGALRTRCIGYSKCDFVQLMDADERVWASLPRLTCTGTGKFPDTLTPDLRVTIGEQVNQHDLLRQQMDRTSTNGHLALCLSRRHWFGKPSEWERPCQNWNAEPDWQLRTVKNTPFLCYDPEVKMHEKILYTPTWAEPPFARMSVEDGPFIDHYSLHFKSLEPVQNSEDAKIYEQLEPGCVKGMWLEHFPKA